ncbi:hypothetical protein [Pararhodospirillum oryzae]|uniref:hypothetical protein n=1 Tax=Pararhodospirillum oryzae TaxID=478448 RepID=UPI0011BDA0A0|nr:hypothetical protein [Pararhodospirillum oryzae]
MAGKQYSPAQLAKHQEKMARFRMQRRRLEEQRRQRRRREMIRSIKLFFIITALLITGIATFILLNGAWTLVDPILKR